MTGRPGHEAMLLTPAGAGAIGVIRVLGPDPVALVNSLFRAKSGPPLSKEQADRLRYGAFTDGDETIDDVIVSVIWVHGRPAVDISAHGGVRVVERILGALEARGAAVVAPAERIQFIWPGENMVEREILHAMTLAKTQRALRFLARQRGLLVTALHEVAALIRCDRAAALQRLQTMVEGGAAAKRLVHGATVALVGPTNSGKSTLFNRMLGRTGVVVSPMPGTTRDWIAEAIEVEGVPITLVDTAGVNEGAGPLERLAIEAGRRMAENAEVRVLVLDGADPRHTIDAWDSQPSLWPDVAAFNKLDEKPPVHLHSASARSCPRLALSARTGEGVEKLTAQVLRTLGFQDWDETLPYLFTERQGELAVRSACAPTAEQAERCILDELIAGGPVTGALNGL